MIIRCQACGAKNRVRLPSGQRIRVRCGSCGEAIPISRRLLMVKLTGAALGRFFASILPEFLIAAVGLTGRVLGVFFSPLKLLWRRLPPNLRRRTSWVLVAALAVVYLFAEGTVRFSSLALLAALLLLASLAVLVAARGPGVVMDMLGRARRKLFRTCPSCGHHHFGWVKSCPRCGEG